MYAPQKWRGFGPTLRSEPRVGPLGRTQLKVVDISLDRDFGCKTEELSLINPHLVKELRCSCLLTVPRGHGARTQDGCGKTLMLTPLPSSLHRGER